MAIKCSTGLRDGLLKTKSWKKSLEDKVLSIYSGTAPSTADDAVTGTLLVSLTLASGTFTSGTLSTRQIDTFNITGSPAEADTVTVTITPTGGTVETYTYTVPAGPTTDTVAIGVAALIDASDYVEAIASTATTESAILIRSRFAGEGFASTTAKTGTLTISVTGAVTPTVANIRLNGLHFELPSTEASGTLDKETGVWSGAVTTTGIASWFRVQANNDAGTLSTTAVRLQGNISTANSELDIPSLTLTSGSTYTQGTFSITLPA
jgi:hypothetical protein